MAERWGQPANLLDDDSTAWQLEAFYLAQAAVTYTTILRPEKIIFGGGVPHRDVLMSLVRKSFAAQLSDYLAVPNLDDYLVRAGNGDDAGILGSFYLAKTLV